MAAEHASVEEFLATFAKSWETNDGEAVASHFTADGSLVNPFGERADGREAVAAMYSHYFSGMLAGTTISSRVGTVRSVGDDHAFTDGEQTIVGADGEVALVVNLAALLERDGDTWRFADSRPYIVPPLPGSD